MNNKTNIFRRVNYFYSIVQSARIRFLSWFCHILFCIFDIFSLHLKKVNKKVKKVLLLPF